MLITEGITVDISTAIKKYKAIGKSTALTERQRAVFESKFGISDNVIKGDKDVAHLFSISAIRVRQLYTSVLYKIGVLPDHYWTLKYK